MQDFLTQTSVVFEMVSFGYVAGSFALYAHRRIQQDAQWEKRTGVCANQRMAGLSTATASIAKVTTAPAPPVPASAPQRQLSPVELLRQQCQQAGIKWRDAHGKNRHLKKAEMIEALNRLTASKQATPPTKATPAKRKTA